MDSGGPDKHTSSLLGDNCPWHT